MIKVQNLSYSFPQKNLYNNISFTLETGQHCAFIGASGSGKSTLVEMIIDPEKYMFDGEIEKNPISRVGYVSQLAQPDGAEKTTVFEYIAKGFLNLQNQITSICTEMETSTDIQPLLEKYQQALDAFEAMGGDDFESRINKKLSLAGLTDQKEMQLSELSGGEFKLIKIIKEMLKVPDLMIMDEPDVFLDFENLNGLKDLINSHSGTLLVITHNRYLLNHCFNKIIHLENMELQEFDGRYIDYNFTLLQSKVELQELAMADDEEIARNEILIDRLRALATSHSESFRGKSLNARVKIQERLEASRIKAPFVYIKQPDINLTTNNVIEETTALKVKDYTIAFDDVLLDNISFEIKSTDKVALVGPNGTGKTTLLREIFRNNSSSIEKDNNIEMAYLSQLQGEMLDESNTVLQEFFDTGFKTSEEIELYLSGYGFDESILSQRIQSLSGGEKNILQLAKIAAGNANLLLLDEPTSHLDTYSQIALEEAIKNYNGAVLMVSHDFYSIANCVDYILMIENKTVRKLSTKKFKKIIYGNHFDREYLELEEKKKSLETRIELALKDNNFTLAKSLLEDLQVLIDLL